MKILKKALIALLILSSALCNSITGAPTKSPAKGPDIDIVFCLDATGSMNGLIRTAKEKIWEIVTNVSQTQPAPNIRLGMVFYRDKGDDFITKPYVLTSNIDSLYDHLLNIQAQGGGDTPESVNAALYEAVENMGWSMNNQVYQTIFLVGDCPPHTDYKDDIKYEVSCGLAAKRDIFINTIKLGNSCTEAIKHFDAIAGLTGGDYQQYAQDARDIVYTTPYDDSVNYYSYLLDKSKLYYGNSDSKAYMKTKQAKALSFYDRASLTSNCARAEYNLSDAGLSNMWGRQELIQDLIDKDLDITQLKKEELPEAMQGLDDEEMRIYIDEQIAHRKFLLGRLKHFNKLRKEYIERKIAEASGQDGFSARIMKVIRKQAKSRGVITG